MSDFRLKVFQSVAKNLSFTKASQELFVSQPAITKHIQELETYYQARLFDRQGNKISLTKAGELLLKHSEKILDDYKQLEYKQLELLQNLVRQLKDYYTSQMWGFNYTDTIGSVCQRFYNLTNDSSIRALFLFIILEVGISHNRFYVMGIGETLIRNVKNNLTEAMELYSLLKQQPVYLSRLDITKRDLPEILQPYCN